ncbi:hypothetical protein [Paraburkholderia aromaticivorans]
MAPVTQPKGKTGAQLSTLLPLLSRSFLRTASSYSYQPATLAGKK